jgi:hypothetical protein
MARLPAAVQQHDRRRGRIAAHVDGQFQAAAGRQTPRPDCITLCHGQGCCLKESGRHDPWPTAAGKISTREFLPTPLPLPVVREILEVARWSPSGGNLQPWKVIVVSGAERDAVSAIGKAIGPEGTRSEEDADPIYPPKLWEPYRTRRFQLGEAMYALLGIGREDRSA